MARNCVNNQYTFQEFLLECPYDGIMIENCMITYLEELQDHHVGYNLLDYMDGIVRRTIELSELDQLIEDARASADQAYRKATYKECLDFIVDYAVEIPIYQRQNCVTYSTQRVNTDTIVKDATPFYDWSDALTDIQMR